MGDTPLVAAQAAQIMLGQKPSAVLIAEAARVAATEETDPTTDIHATADYKRHLAEVLARRALQQAVDRAAVSIGERATR
jgi:carbon-monoxide dehydrogenase medium subunit